MGIIIDRCIGHACTWVWNYEWGVVFPLERQWQLQNVAFSKKFIDLVARITCFLV